MKNTVLPVALAVAAALSASTVFADTIITQEMVQVESTEINPIIDDQLPLINTPENFTPYGIEYSGYAIYGAKWVKDGKAETVGAIGQTAAAVGILGNGGNGGEFQLAKGFEPNNGTEWDLVVMIDKWGDNLGLPKLYASVTNLFESQPQMSLWAGRDFHQRNQAGLNDYFWSSHDGFGAGFYNLNLGGTVMLDASFMEQDLGRGTYALTSKLKGIDLGFGGLTIQANYGFGNKDITKDGDFIEFVNGKPTYESVIDIAKETTSYQVAGILDMSYSAGWNQIVVRYTDNGVNSVYARQEGLDALYVQWEGGADLTDNFTFGYQFAYEGYDNANAEAGDADGSRNNYGLIIRPQYQWTDAHSTWLETGYTMVDYDDAGENSSWKVTLSQNVAIAAGGGARPMIRFYATYGEYENEVGAGSLNGVKQDTFFAGAQFEAWW